MSLPSSVRGRACRRRSCCRARPGAAAPSREEQRQEIGEVVREYLLKNPEVLQEVMAELEKRQQESRR